MLEAQPLLHRMFEAAIARAQPAICLPPFLVDLLDGPSPPTSPRGRTIVVGAGKAAAAMAHTIEDLWPGEISGLVVTRHGHAVPTRRIEVIEAGHPVPDENGSRAAERMLNLVHGLSADDLVLALFSGGGSALLTLPAPGLSLMDKQAVNRALLKSGATISELNCVRKHLSAIKGGRLARACYPARVVTFAISDVPSDDPSVIASGPTVPDPTTFEQARAVLARHRIPVPPAIDRHLRSAGDETPKPGDPRSSAPDVRVIATAQDALEAAAAVAREAGLHPLILSDSLEGESRHVASMHAGIVRQILRHRQPVAPPCVLLSGGETTVTVTGRGRGGRNVEFLLALAIALGPEAGVHAVAGDTDGIDGTEDNAGARLTPDTLLRAQTLGLDPSAYLFDNDAYGFFSHLGDLVTTGPTLTNVNDFRAILVVPDAASPRRG